MKLEKREITLNEADSLQDIYLMEKTLAGEYSERVFKAMKKETKNVLLRLMKETVEELWAVEELWRRSVNQN